MHQLHQREAAGALHGGAIHTARNSPLHTAQFPCSQAHFTAAVFTGEIDERRGTWTPNVVLREQYPLGLAGCWLVNRVVIEKLKGRDASISSDFDA